MTPEQKNALINAAQTGSRMPPEVAHDLMDQLGKLAQTRGMNINGVDPSKVAQGALLLISHLITRNGGQDT